LNSAFYLDVTGTAPQTLPITIEQYRKHGYLFFEVYKESTGIAEDLGLVKSIAEIDGVKE
jgi:hypothetical protein